jgi:hypothetical protein
MRSIPLMLRLALPVLPAAPLQKLVIVARRAATILYTTGVKKKSPIATSARKF